MRWPESSSRRGTFQVWQGGWLCLATVIRGRSGMAVAAIPSTAKSDNLLGVRGTVFQGPVARDPGCTCVSIGKVRYHIERAAKVV